MLIDKNSRKSLADAEMVWEALLKTLKESEIKIQQNEIDKKLQLEKLEELKKKNIELTKTVNFAC